MKAMLYHEFKQPLALATVADPAPSPTGVVLKVTACGICRSDWHGWQGHDPDIKTLPHIPGHELVGEVVAVGAEVRRWKGGERVTVPFSGGCGTCPECLSGNQQICNRDFQPGFTGWGGFAEYVALEYADVNLVALPPEIDDVTAASLGCRFITAFRAVVAQGRVAPGQWLAVQGCGGVGLSAIMIGRAMGAQVIGVDINDHALTLAQQLGATLTLNARAVADVPTAIRDLTHGGAHVSLDALGSVATAQNSVLCLRKRGRHVQVGLLAGQDKNPPMPMGAVIGRELTLVGSHGMQAHEYPAMLEMIATGRLAPRQLVGRLVSLEEAGQVLVAMNEFQHVGMAVIDRF